MHYGVYKGGSAAAQRKKILILGESHHDEDGQGKRGKYPTKKVIEDYLAQEGTTEDRLHFFHKIARSFGIDRGKDEEKTWFWDKVFFGNYVDVVCGVGDSAAKRQIEENRETYRQEFVEFINEQQIDFVFCFSILVYWELWNLSSSSGQRIGILPDEQGNQLTQITVARRKNKNVYLRGYACKASSLFDHPVTVYGIPHPSGRGGFDSNHFVEYLKPIFRHCCE